MKRTSVHFVVSAVRVLRWYSYAISLVGILIASGAGAGDLLIWDDQPAAKWDTAYPVGNGRLGAMPWGTFPEEKILINEETIWARRDTFGMREDSHKHLEEVRRLEAAGDYAGADQYFEKHLQNAQDPCGYQLLGWLKLLYQDVAPLKRIRRELDLKTGIATNVYVLDDGTEITQKVFVSGPADVVAVVISSSRALRVKVALDDSKIEDGDIVKIGAAE